MVYLLAMLTMIATSISTRVTLPMMRETPLIFPAATLKLMLTLSLHRMALAVRNSSLVLLSLLASMIMKWAKSYAAAVAAAEVADEFDEFTLEAW